MNHSKFAQSALAAAFATLMAQAPLSLAAHPAMESESYFDARIYAERNKPSHEISEYRYKLSINSLSEGLGGKSVPLLGVEQGPGRSEVMNALLERLGSLGLDTREVRMDTRNKRRMAAYGNGWKLKVFGDGTRVQFRNYAELDPKEQTMGRMGTIKPEQLVELGRRFIAGELAEQVRLGPGEELVPFGVQYQVNAMQSTEGEGKVEEQTVGGTVIFSRKVQGVDVLGRGSKVAVMFANDGSLYGFDYDWPDLYQTKQEQKTAGIKELQRRAVEVARLEESADSARLERFECGYYDAGQSKRNDVPLQPACYHFYSGESAAKSEDGEGGMLTMAFSDPVPAGTEIIPDDNWDTALELLYGPDAVPERAKPGEQSPERSDLRAQLTTGKEARF